MISPASLRLSLASPYLVAYLPVRSDQPSTPRLSARTTCSTHAPSVYLSIEETTRAPRFLPNSCLHAPLFDPGGSSAPRPCAALNAAFRSKDHVGSAFKSISGLNHAACRPSVYASQPRSLSDHATLDLGRRLTFAEAGLTPASSFRRFLIYMSFYISLPLLQALPGAPFARFILESSLALLYPAGRVCARRPSDSRRVRRSRVRRGDMA